MLRRQQQQPQQPREVVVVEKVVEVPVQVPVQVPVPVSGNNATPSTVSAGAKSEFSWKQLSSQSSEEISNERKDSAKEFVSRYLQVN